MTAVPSRIIRMLAIPTLSVALAVSVTVWPVSGEYGEAKTETFGGVVSLYAATVKFLVPLVGSLAVLFEVSLLVA